MIIAVGLFLTILAIFMISALPLYFSVNFFGGKTTIFKVIFINILVAFVAFIVKVLFESWTGLLIFILMIWIYKDFFKLGWVRALLAWLLQFVFAGIIIIIIILLFGVSILI